MTQLMFPNREEMRRCVSASVVSLANNKLSSKDEKIIKPRGSHTEKNDRCNRQTARLRLMDTADQKSI